MNPAKRHAIFNRLRAANPQPASELEYRSPFELLVAVVLSAQATDKSVNLATRELFQDRRHAAGRSSRSASPGSSVTSGASGFTAPRRKTSSRHASC